MHHEKINYATKKYPFLINHSDLKYIPHFHDETELIYVLEGNLDVTIESKSFTLKEGEICIITPEVIHNLYSYEPNKTFVMKLFPVVDLSNIELANNVIKPNDDNYQVLKNYISEIMSENKNKKLGYELCVNINAEKILLMILRNMKYKRLDDRTKIKLVNRGNFLDSVCEFLEKYYTYDFSIEDVAKHFNYTKSYFCHYFKRITGVTFWRYYTIFRLEKAIEIMKKHPDKSYAEVALNSGFKNIRSFNQAFKEYHHCSPREYMKNYYPLKDK